MSNPISVSSLKQLILRSNDPKAKIDLLLRTLPYTISQEQARSDMNIAVVKGLQKRLEMVEGLAKNFPQQDNGIWSEFAEEELLKVA